MQDIMTPVAVPVEEETPLNEVAARMAQHGIHRAVAAGTGMAEPHPSYEERTRMTPETFTRQWAQIRQHLRGWWDHLTEHDLEHIAGHHDQLVQVIQERYQYLHERAQAEVDQRLQAYEPTGGQLAEALITAADEAAARLTEAGEAAAAGASPLALDAGGLVALVRRHPVASVLIGLGGGVLLARGLARTRFP
jgi:CBS domain-containing protein